MDNLKYPIKHMLLAWLFVFGGSICVAVFGNSAISAMADFEKENRSPIIVIDAGHGGEDGGAVSCTGEKESKINLDISLRIRDLLNLMGYKTQMTRTKDESLSTEGTSVASRKLSDLKNRANMIKDSSNQILVSIHQNYFTQNQYHGPQVFYNAIPESKILATIIQDQFSKLLVSERNRDIKMANGIYLMDAVNCCGVLVECGFLSNPREEAQLRSSAYQKKVAAVIATGLSVFLS